MVSVVLPKSRPESRAVDSLGYSSTTQVRLGTGEIRFWELCGKGRIGHKVGFDRSEVRDGLGVPSPYHFVFPVGTGHTLLEVKSEQPSGLQVSGVIIVSKKGR